MLIRAINRSESKAPWRFPAERDTAGRHPVTWAVLLLAMCLATPASAQVKNCGGVFTDRPCNEVSSSSEPSLTIRPTSKPSSEEVRSLIEAKATIQTLIHDLRTKRFNAQRRYNVRVDISEAETACGRKETNLDRCRQIVKQLDKELEEQIASHSQPKATPTSTPLPPAAKGATVIQENNSVVVIQQQVRPRPTPWFVIESGPLYRSRGSSNSRHPSGDKPGGDRDGRPRPPPQQGPPLRINPPLSPPGGSTIIDGSKQ